MDYVNLNPGLKCLACAAGDTNHDCHKQRSAQKVLYEAGILRRYQLFDLDRDWTGQEGSKKIIKQYLENVDNARIQGIGLHLFGSWGLGKTALVGYILKEIAKKKNPLTDSKYSVYLTTFSEMITMYTSGWYDTIKRESFTKKIKLTDFLVIDDLGKEFASKSNLNIAALDEVLRFRMSDNRPTIITTNRSLQEIENDYGEGILSLIVGDCIPCKIEGVDFRLLKKQQLMDLLVNPSDKNTII